MFTNKNKILSHLRFRRQGRLQSRRRGESRESMDHICLRLPGVGGMELAS